MNKIEAAVFMFVIFSFALGIYLYPKMPESMAGHWNINGDVDAYWPKFWGLFLMPIISLVMLGLLIIIPKIDPKKGSIEKFRKYYDGFIVALILFLFYIHILTLLWSFGYFFNMGQALAPAFGALFFYIGVLVSHAKQNWFVGIRTPWTMSNSKVWDKTHKLGGKLFKAAGLIALFGAAFPQLAFYLVILPALIVTASAFAYSYFAYKSL